MTNETAAGAKIEPVTTLGQGDTITVPIRVLDVRASNHSYFGPHDLISVEVTEATGDLPAGLRFQMRRPQDGSSDLRSSARRERRDAGRADMAQPALPPTDPSMTLKELIAIADARGIDTGAKPTKAKLLALLSE